MAKKDTTSTKAGSKRAVSKDAPTPKRFNADTAQFVIGLFLIVLALYFLISFVSFFITGSADQSIISLPDPEEHLSEIRNYTGLLGARVSNFFINDCFGYAAICIPAFLLVCGFRLIHVGHFYLWKWFLALGLGMVWSSVFLAFIEGSVGELTFFCPGGLHGKNVHQWMYGRIGWPGTFLVLMFTAIIYLVYLSKQTIYWVRKVFSLGLHSMHRKKSAATAEESASDTVEPTPDTDSTSTEANAPAPPAEETEQTIELDLDHTPGGKRNASAPAPSPIETEKTTFTVEKAGNAEQDAEKKEVELTIDPIAAESEEVPENMSIMEKYNPRLGLEYYKFPTIDLLKNYGNEEPSINMEEQTKNKDRIVTTLRSFGIEISSIKATVGPTVTLYEITPESGVRIAKIRNLEDDIALSLSALGIRIIAPIPGKGTIGIEVPNEHPRIVSMQSILASRKFQESSFDLPIALGRTITNDVYMVDLCKMPHLLVAGATGQGKSVGLNAIITSLLYKKHPSELKFVLVDPKKVEFSIYSGIEKNYLAKLPDAEEPIITDVTKVVQTLNSICMLMDARYDLLKKAHARNIKEYNEKFINRKLNPNNGHDYMPYIVVIIDEFGDLIMTAGREVELPIARIAQLARAVGIHMVIATQRPTTNIITGTIKANFPARMAFRVTTMMDSRTILDRPGANQLIGKGDMLFLQGTDPVRVQCAFVDTPEVERINEFISDQQSYPAAYELPEYKGDENSGLSGAGGEDMGALDELFEEAARLIVIHQSGSTSLIQRKFSIGYNRAGRLMDQLERAGIVGPSEGSKPREVKCADEVSLERILNGMQ